MNTQQAKQIHINDYLEKIGAKFARTQNGTHGLEYVYHCPNRNDKTPSLCVNIEKNVWSDVPQGAGGRIIELVCYLNQLTDNDVRGALALLDGTFPYISQTSTVSSNVISKAQMVLESQQETNSGDIEYKNPLIDDWCIENVTGLKKKRALIKVEEVKELFSYPLKDYLENIRKINLAIAKHYIKEVYCTLTLSGKQFYAIGFPSGSTYAIRNKNFKGFAGQGADISIFEYQTDSVLLFEGFMDFLSYLSAKKITKPVKTAVVLNSSSMIIRFIDYVNNHPNIKNIEYFRDRDEINNKETGLKSLDKLTKALPSINIIDVSEAYQQYNDLNDWWVAKNQM